MTIKRAFSSVLLFAFAVFSAGGSGLHYAPLFGHHHFHETESQEEIVPSCCGHVHHSEPDDSASRLASNHDQSDNCDGHCLICEFFSSITLECITESSFRLDVAVVQAITGQAKSVDIDLIPVFYQRGPPLA